MARLDRIDGVATSSALRMFLCGGWMEWGTGERGRRGAVERSSGDLFMARPTFATLLRKRRVFLADSASLADGLSRNFVGESASWPNGTSGKSINQQPPQNSGPNKTLHGPQPSVSLARSELQCRCQWLHHFMARYYITCNITNDHQPIVLGLFVVGYNSPTPSTAVTSMLKGHAATKAWASLLGKLHEAVRYHGMRMRIASCL
jgi:hypothetical protein